jgi:hypothetical protein
MGATPVLACGTRNSANTMHGTHMLNPVQNTIKMFIIKKMNNEWQMAGMNE